MTTMATMQDPPKGTYMPLRACTLSERDFRRISHLVTSTCGIKLSQSKRAMVESRLQRRLRELSLCSYEEYCTYLFSEAGQRDEFVHLVDAVTTNTTSFFREPQHFKYLRETVLEQWRQSHDRNRVCKVWSAACSSGEEPYTLAMVLAEFAREVHWFQYRVTATDVSPGILRKAAGGVYTEERAEGIPTPLKHRYAMRSKDRAKALVRIVPELRSNIDFRLLNFMWDSWGDLGAHDVIFCRNVLIYFNKETQFSILDKLCSRLRPGGHLFIGHSESLAGLTLPVAQVAPTIYRKLEGV